MDSKVYMFPESSGNSVISALAPLLQQRGVDPSVLYAMNRNNGFGEGGWFMWVIFLFFLMGCGNWGNRNGENGLAGMINSDAGRELLMQGINGNQAAISQLSTTLNCDINMVQQAINAVMSNVQNVANQVGQSSLQVINAIQQGNSQLAGQLANCCCENRLAICNQTNTLQQAINSVATGQERGFSSVAYETQRQTCDLQNSIKDATGQILAGQRAAEMRELQREIAERDSTIAKQDVIINNGQQTAVFSQMIQQATAPIVNAVTGLQKDIDCVKCHMPKTTTVPYTDIIGIPAYVAAQYGIGLGLGVNNIWG